MGTIIVFADFPGEFPLANKDSVHIGKAVFVFILTDGFFQGYVFLVEVIYFIVDVCTAFFQNELTVREIKGTFGYLIPVLIVIKVYSGLIACCIDIPKDIRIRIYRTIVFKDNGALPLAV